MSGRDLATALGGDAPDLPALSAAEVERLAALIVEAKTRQSKALDDAIAGGMGHIPRLLRGPVKAILFR